VVSIRSRRNWPPTFSTSSPRRAAISERSSANSLAIRSWISRRSICSKRFSNACIAAASSARAIVPVRRTSTALPVWPAGSDWRCGARLPNTEKAANSSPHSPARIPISIRFCDVLVTMSHTATAANATASTNPRPRKKPTPRRRPASLVAGTGPV
jgi:hypothetical protein